ncbi:MAG: endonuclease [Frankiales bacterium]|nr:endonuclease [Frankiales bacterium]
MSNDDDTLAWAQLLLSVLDEGRRTATYKLAVLLALVDCCVTGTGSDGRAPQRVSTRDVAGRVLELYWGQVRPYPTAGGVAAVLRQSSQPRAITVDAVGALRRSTEASSPAAARLRAPQAYEDTLDVVELNLVQMPLGKLQRPSDYSADRSPAYPRFLYDDAAFHERVTARQLRAHPLHVELAPGVPDRLVGLAGLLRPLLEVHWTRAVAAFNRTAFPDDGLREFLFGADRTTLATLRDGLGDAQHGRCFYCAGPLSPGRIQVDHFVPWSRVPNDALGNLVLADSTCNGSKRDHFADLPLVERWARRPAAALQQVSEQRGWPLELGQSRRLARGLYAHLPDGARLWQERGVFAVLDRARLRDLLPLLGTD